MEFNGSYFIQEKGEPIDLWNPNIEWHYCPKELALAVILVEHAREPDMIERYNPYASDCVHVSGHYVVAADNHRICRSKLPNPAPFDMAIYHVEPSTPHETQGGSLFSGMDDGKHVLSRVAKLNINAENGLAFDFGDHHGWCYSVPDDWKKDFVNTINPLFEGNVKKVLQEISDEVCSVAESYYEAALAEFYCGKQYPMTVKIGNGIIHFLVEMEDEIFENKVPLNTDCFVHSLSFEVDPIFFFEAVRRWCSMAVINNEKLNKNILYFKETKYDCEHLLACDIQELKIK